MSPADPEAKPNKLIGNPGNDLLDVIDGNDTANGGGTPIACED